MDPWPIEGDENGARVRRLWLSVILRAKLDAEGQDLMADSVEFEGPFIVKDAREWLTTLSFDLLWVCELAGVEVKELTEHFRRTYGRLGRKNPSGTRK